MADITVYGVDDCEDTRRVRAFLDSRGTQYRYVNIDRDKEAERLLIDENDGKRRTPLVIVQFGTEARRLREPSNEDLDAALRDIEALDRAA